MSINISSNGVHNGAGFVPPDGTSVAPTPPLPGPPPPPISHASVDLPLAAEALWPVLSDLNHLERWLTFHDCWRSDVPIEVMIGTEMVQQVTLAGWTGAVAWTVQEYQSPNLLRLSGTGLRDAKVTLELTIEPIGYWSRVIAEMEFTGWAATGAAGVVLELGATRELEMSLANLEHLVG